MRITESLSTRHETSDEAFARTPSGVRARLLEAIRERPRTVDELMQDLHLTHSTASAAVNALMRMGLVQDLGVRAPTRSGRTAIVWEPSLASRGFAAPPTRQELQERIDRACAMLRVHGGMDSVLDVLEGRIR